MRAGDTFDLALRHPAVMPDVTVSHAIEAQAAGGSPPLRSES
ncbi:hypothetical protein [Microvirga arabica]|nr:hypothetical protein [Microvirga arabica]